MHAPQSHALGSRTSAQLSEADNAFFLGLYRNAVAFYQPKIEKRTGVPLGSVGVRDFRELDKDIMRDLERKRYPWLFRLLKRSIIKTRLRQWRDYLESTHHQRAKACTAQYYKRTVYVSFSHDIRCHEDGIAFTAVHELCHALWETLAGEPLPQIESAPKPEQEKLSLLAEGYATYGEQTWFLDLYPECVRKIVFPPERGSVHFRGMQCIQDLVKRFGSEILLEIPKRWRSL